MTGPYILALLLLYMLGLFVVAWRADRSVSAEARPRRRRLIHALSLAVLCSSLTYFGAVGIATRRGWDFIPNILGPILGIVLLYPIWRRVAVAAKRENVGSIADFLSSRYGKSRALGTLVAIVAMVSALPYIASQLITLAGAWGRVAGGSEPPLFALPIIVAALAVFAILLGARRPMLTTHSRGLVRVVAIESVVKLAGLLAVAGLGVVLLAGKAGWQPGAASLGPLADPPAITLGFLTTTLLSMVAIGSLPRQFHLTFVELEEVDDLKTARWLLPLYMGLVALAVPLIAIAGRALLDGEADMYVVCLPLKYAGLALTGLALVGGFSASASMVMVEVVALSGIISNELVLPLMTRFRLAAGRSGDIARTIVNIRRAAIVVMLLLAWGYFIAMQGNGITRLGSTALSASAQIAPALIGAVLWRRGHARGAIAGILGGIATWIYAVALPQFSPE